MIGAGPSSRRVDHRLDWPQLDSALSDSTRLPNLKRLRVFSSPASSEQYVKLPILAGQGVLEIAASDQGFF